ncbi:hypothetical protein F4818DRAFT_246871 [Hypoxylon cercidicola]|nr:hypothetical protein F4818DRAFT_246871 [Hypoxylon cercidicola]
MLPEPHLRDLDHTPPFSLQDTDFLPTYSLFPHMIFIWARMDTAHYDGDVVTTCIWVGSYRLTTTIILCYATVWSWLLPRPFFYTRLQAGGEKKFSFFFYLWLVFLSMDRLLPTCCPDPAKGEAATFIITRLWVCEFPTASSRIMHYGEHWTDCIYMPTTPAKDYLPRSSILICLAFPHGSDFLFRACTVLTYRLLYRKGCPGFQLSGLLPLDNTRDAHSGTCRMDLPWISRRAFWIAIYRIQHHFPRTVF